MSGEPLVEELTLDIQPALTALEPIGSAFEGIISSFSEGLASGISSALGNIAGIDTTGITTAVEGALTDAASTPVVVEGDVTGLDTALSDALSAPAVVPVDGDPTGLVDAIDTATASAPDVPLSGDATDLVSAIDAAASEPVVVPVEADTAGALQALAGLEGESVTVEVDADVSGAQDQIGALGNSATEAASGVTELGGAVEGLHIATGLARGETEGLATGIAGLSAGAATGVAALAAFTGFIGESVSLAADAEAQNKRFASTFGDLAEKVKQIDVGGLNIDLETLGKQSGTTNANLEATASRIGLLGQSAHASNDTIVSTTQNLLALGATISVNNPRLGDAAAVTDRLTNAFARGGRALAPFGIALSSAQINAEALKETSKTSASELTLFEKATAGANLALGIFGDTLGSKFQDGAQNAQVQFRALKVQLEETLVAIGGPLLGPLISSLHDAIPVAQELGIALGNLASAVLPIVAALTPALGPVAAILGAVGAGITVLDDAVKGLEGPQLLGIAAGLGAIAISSGLASTAVFELGLAFDTALGPIGIAVGALALLGFAFGHFHSDSATVKVDAEAIATALLESSNAADVLTGKTNNLSDALEKQLQKTLETGKSGQTALDGANALGLSYADLTKILLGTESAFLDFQVALDPHGTDAQKAAQLSLGETISQTRAKLEAEAQAAINAAIANGTLTKEQLRGANGRKDDLTSLDGIITVYEKLKPTIEAAAAAQQKSNLQSAVTTGALRDTIAAFNPAKDSVAEYTAKLVEMGVAQADADQLAKDQAAGLQKTADSTIIAGSAVRDLNLAFVEGRIGATQLEGGVFALGTSLAAAQADVSDLQKGIDSFAKTATGALPDTGQAVSSFSKGVQDAFKGVVDAANKSPAEVAAAQAKLRQALNPDAFIADLGREAASIASFQANLATLVSEGLGQLAGVIAAKGPEVGGALASTFANDHTKAVAADGAISLVNTATSNFNAFASGPEAAAQMGAGGTALATAANAGYATAFAIDHPTQTQIDSALFILTAAEPQWSDATRLTGIAAVTAFETEFGRLPTVTEVQTGAAQTALDNAKGPLGEKAAAAGAEVTDKYGNAVDVPGKTKGSIEASKSLWDPTNQVTRDTADVARTGGSYVGLQFNEGIASGLRLQLGLTHIHDAAAAAAGQAKAGANSVIRPGSPSRLGIELGENFIEGIATGLTHTGSISTATGPLNATLSSAIAPVADTSTIDEAIKKLDELIAKEHQQQQAAASFTAAQVALNQFVSSAVGALPSASNAVRSFSTDVISAMTAVTKAEADTAKARAKFEADTSKLQGAVILAQQKRDFDIAHGASQRQIFLDQAAVDKAQHDLTVASLLDTKALQDATSGLGTAQKTLSLSSDPAKFIASLNKQNAATADFTKDIKILAGRGLTDLAQLLASQGPEVAGALADALVASPAKAKLAEKAIDAGKKVSGDFQKSLTDEFAVNGTTVATALGEGVGLSILKGSHAAITASGDLLFSALTDPFKGKSVTVPVTLTSPTIKLPPAGTVATNAANAISSFTTNALSSLTLDLNLMLEDGRVVQTQVTVPVKPNGQAKQRATAKVKAKARA